MTGVEILGEIWDLLPPVQSRGGGGGISVDFYGGVPGLPPTV